MTAMKTLAALGLMLTTSVLLAQESPASAPAPANARARQGTLRAIIKLDGKFQPARPAEIELDCERFRGSFKLEMIAPHGSWVNKGDVIARIVRKPYAEVSSPYHVNSRWRTGTPGGPARDVPRGSSRAERPREALPGRR